jgi:bifunctional non-homologous end joining protein LigD
MLFVPFKPMEPIAARSVPQSENYLYQVKWDGVRLIAHTGNGRLLLHNRKLLERTHHYPELNCLQAFSAAGAILDGELVALKDGRPSFPLVLQRDLAVPDPGKVRRLMSSIPVIYMVFDILWYNGRALLSLPLIDRQELLAEVLPANDYINRVENFQEGVFLFEAVKNNKTEGIVAKERESNYYPGKKLPLWQKIKVRQKQLVTVGGYTIKEGQINSLLAGAYLNGRLIYLGRVAAGLSARDLAELTCFLKASERPVSPFANKTAAIDQVWVEPRLTMLVEFQEWTADLHMRQPVVKGFTKDKPKNCVLDSG